MPTADGPPSRAMRNVAPVTSFAERIDAITLEQLRAQRTVKWTAAPTDGIGAFVAEMDFGVAPVVIDALEQLTAEQNFGYLAQPLEDDLAEACANWQRDHY